MPTSARHRSVTAASPAARKIRPGRIRCEGQAGRCQDGEVRPHIIACRKKGGIAAIGERPVGRSALSLSSVMPPARSPLPAGADGARDGDFAIEVGVLQGGADLLTQGL